MRRIIIELLTRERNTGDARDDSYIALASYEGELLSKAGVGAGDTHRQAAQEAINSYFSRREAEANPPAFISTSEIAAGSITTDLPPIPVYPASTPAPRVETTPEGVLRYLREAIVAVATPKLTMNYENGECVETTRDIYPSEIVNRDRPFPEPYYLKAVDVAKNEPRTFRLDRIISVRAADA